MRKHIAWLALAAFALNLFLPFFATYGVPTHASIFGKKILLCTGDGFKWVTLADLQTGKEKPRPHAEKCPLCYLAHYAAALPDAATHNIAPPSEFVSLTHRSFLISLRIAGPPGSRAPPSFIG